MDDSIKVVDDDGIVTITLNRPDKLNALVGHMRRDLAEALAEALKTKGGLEVNPLSTREVTPVRSAATRSTSAISTAPA